MDAIWEIFDAGDFMPRGSCGHWSPIWKALSITCDLICGLSHMAIPAALVILWLIKRRVYGRASNTLLLFAAVFLSHGFACFGQMAAWYWPAHRLFTLIAVPGALASIACVFKLPASVWHIVQLPLPSQLLTAIEESRAVRDQLEAVNVELRRKTRVMEASIHRLERAKQAIELAEQSDRWREQQFEHLTSVQDTLRKAVS